MYLLMSAFHSAPWLKLIVRPAQRSLPSQVQRRGITAALGEAAQPRSALGPRASD